MKSNTKELIHQPLISQLVLFIQLLTTLKFIWREKRRLHKVSERWLTSVVPSDKIKELFCLNDERGILAYWRWVMRTFKDLCLQLNHHSFLLRSSIHHFIFLSVPLCTRPSCGTPSFCHCANVNKSDGCTNTWVALNALSAIKRFKKCRI